MTKKTVKTNAMRLLDAAKIQFEVLTYADDFHSADEVAALIGVPAETVYKTLVVLPESGQGKPLLVMIPATNELNLKGLAVGEKKLRMATKREAEGVHQNVASGTRKRVAFSFFASYPEGTRTVKTTSFIRFDALTINHCGGRHSGFTNFLPPLLT